MFAFTDEQRAIFEYDDGTKIVKADPLEIRRRLLFTIPHVTQLTREQDIGERMLAQKERQIYRMSVERVIHEALKHGALGMEEIIKSVDPTNAKFVSDMVIHLLNAGALEETGGKYRSVEAAKYFNDAEEAIKMTSEEMTTIRHGKGAEEKLVNGLRKVFMMEIDEKTNDGPTDAMVWAVFRHYQDWMQKKSGRAPSTPNSSESSAESTPSA